MIAELYEARDLIAFLAWRDIKVRYQQTVLGVLWAVLQPLLFMAIFTVVFGRVANISTGSVPYPLFCFAGLLVWQLFINSLTSAAGTVVGQQNMVQKIYFPRLVLPISSCVVTLLDFVIAFLFFLVMMPFFSFLPSWRLVAVPLLVLVTLVTACGLGAALSALNVRYRDVRYLTNFLAQIWLFATPVAYPLNLIPEKWLPLASLNPMVGIVEGFRWATLGTDAPDMQVLLTSAATALCVAIGGTLLFRRMEVSFADTI